jgi:hypothetical protein
LLVDGSTYHKPAPQQLSRPFLGVAMHRASNGHFERVPMSLTSERNHRVARLSICVAAAVVVLQGSMQCTRGQSLVAPPPAATEQPWDTNVVAVNDTDAGSQSLFPNPGPKTSDAQTAKDGTSRHPPTKDQPATGTPVTGPTNDTDLAKRVAALEEYIRQMQAANNSESLPAPKGDKKKDEKDKAAKDTKDNTIADECVPKKLDTIV